MKATALPSPVTADDRHLGLGYLAGGLLGRTVSVHVDPAAAAAWTDGLSITVRDLNAAETASTVLIQAALISAGSLDQRIMTRLIGRPELARRYLAVEAPRALQALAGRLPRRVLGLITDAVADPPTGSPYDSLAQAQGGAVITPLDPIFGILRPGRVVRNARALAALIGSGEAPEGQLKRNAPTLDDDEAAQDSKILKLFSNIAAGGPLADLFKKIIGAGSQASSDNTDAAGAGEDLSEAAGRKRAGAAGSGAAGPGKRSDVAEPGELSAARRYREWDEGARRYRPAWTRVEEVVPWNPDDIVDVATAVRSPTRDIRRQLARLGLGFDRHRHQATGDEIVTDDLVQLVVDTRSGHGADHRIYRALLKTRRDLGVLILVDTSSSVRDSTPDGRTLQILQLDLAWQLAGALDAAGDRTALFGFNSWGRNRVQMMRAKGFDERLGNDVVERLRHLAPAGFTRMGAAVRHAGHVLRAESGMPFNMVVLITDGLSYDDGYEAGYAEADTRRSIAELQADHIACVCFSVGGDAGAEKLKRVFGDAAFLQAPDVAQITPRLGALFTQALASIYRR